MTDSKNNKSNIKAKVKTETIARKVKVATKSNANPGNSNKAPSITKSSKKQLLNNFIKNQDTNVPDLNKSTGYPVHPNRIWPD